MKFEENICEYLNTLFLINDIYTNVENDSKDSVSIMTVHQSKGMEFNYVIIPFLSSGSFPSRNYKSKNLDNIPLQLHRNSDLFEIDKTKPCHFCVYA